MAPRRRAVAVVAAVALVAAGIGTGFVIGRATGSDVVISPELAQIADAPGTPTAAAPTVTTTVPRGPVQYGNTACPPATGAPSRIGSFFDSFTRCIDPAKIYSATLRITVDTSTYDIVVDLDARRAPVTVNNFVALARSRFFDATRCHRIIPGFVAQCGDPTGTGNGGPGYDFVGELPAAGDYEIGSIAMSSWRNGTSGSQFFLVIGQSGRNIPPDYSLFGRMRAGQDEVLRVLNAAGNPDRASNGIPPVRTVDLLSVAIAER